MFQYFYLVKNNFQVYGYKLVQVEAKGGIQYILILTEENESLHSSTVDPHHRKLLIAALTHIFMTGGPVKEDDMWKFLAEAGLLEENDHTGRKILTNIFTRQLYLIYSKVGEGDLARYVFEWGQRSIEEVPKLFLLNKMAQVYYTPLIISSDSIIWCLYSCVMLYHLQHNYIFICLG
ncbi:unnamed protein product [Diatraea saccharalis]|uniref:MAGE domain-containing protein n=1 Tax=Diatraea saccharalis TaxID=40085 RepID=A0A9P0C7J2_9NEOP|nr:unnamed protein product [Diatraea saccharalis]